MTAKKKAGKKVMNREQRRKLLRQGMKNKRRYNAGARETLTEPEQTDFSLVPTTTICQSIQLLINELKSRGILIYDYDHKDKALQQIRLMQGKVFFLAAEEGQDEET